MGGRLLHIWIDADSCPAIVRDHTVKIGARCNAKVVLVANREISCNEKPFIMIVCTTEKDSADNYIFEKADGADIVITKDILFADRLLKKGICVINDRGTEFTEDNIKQKLSDRNFSMQMEEIGLVKHFHEGYDKKKFSAFANTFDKVLNRQLKKNLLQA